MRIAEAIRRLRLDRAWPTLAASGRRGRIRHPQRPDRLLAPRRPDRAAPARRRDRRHLDQDQGRAAAGGTRHSLSASPARDGRGSVGHGRAENRPTNRRTPARSSLAFEASIRAHEGPAEAGRVLHEESEFRLSAGAAGQRLREEERQNDEPEENPNEESPTPEPGTHCQATPHAFESVLSAWK